MAGAFHSLPAPGRTPIGALAASTGPEVTLQVFWINVDRNIVRAAQKQGGDWPNPSKVVGPLRAGSKFAPAQWEGGKYVRVYYQSEDNSVLEICKDHDRDWYGGATVGRA